MKNKKVPKNLQPALWSVDVKDLDLNKDRAYIINQILAYGTWEEIKWLFKTYTKKVVRRVFIKEPIKIYTPSAFNFSREVLLGIKNKNLDPCSYDRNLPRRIKRS